MNKVDINLEDADLQQLITIVNQYGSVSLRAELTKATDLINEQTYILHGVCNALAVLSGKPVSAIETMAATPGGDDLTYNVQITNYQKQSLKGYFQNIANALNYTKTITVTECGNLNTISDCVKLILSKK